MDEPNFDQIFNHFVSNQNLLGGFNFQFNNQIWMQNGLREITQLEKTLFEKTKNTILDNLSKNLKADLYEPDQAMTYLIPKNIAGCRKMTKLTLTDAIIYQSIFSRNVLGTLIDSKLSKYCFANRLNKGNSIYLADYKISRTKFVRFQQKAIKDGYKYKIDIDAHSYYDFIDHKILFSILEHEFGIPISNQILNILKKQLNKWYPEGRGIPQGYEVSGILANAYLHSIDTIFGQIKGIRYFRYCDDIVLLLKTQNAISPIADKITRAFATKKLEVNNKSNVEYIESPESLDRLLIVNDYWNDMAEGLTKADCDLLIETSPNIGEYLGKLKDFQTLQKHEASHLRYFLRKGGVFNSLHLKEISEAFFYSPAYAFHIAEYISKYIDHEPWLYDWFSAEFKNRYRYLTPWQKYLGIAIQIRAKSSNREKYIDLGQLIEKEHHWELCFESFILRLITADDPKKLVTHETMLILGNYPALVASLISNFEETKNSLSLHSEKFRSVQSILFTFEQKTVLQDTIRHENIDDVIIETNNLIKIIATDMKSKKKFPFKIVDETDSTFKVTFHERLPQIHFNKNERWAHLCFFIIDRGLLQMSPSATDDEIFEYWKMQDKAYSFKDSPYKIESDKLRIAIQQAVETTNKNIIKAFPTMVGKTVFEKQDGGVYLRPTSKK